LKDDHRALDDPSNSVQWTNDDRGSIFFGYVSSNVHACAWREISILRITFSVTQIEANNDAFQYDWMAMTMGVVVTSTTAFLAIAVTLISPTMRRMISLMHIWWDYNPFIYKIHMEYSIYFLPGKQ